MKDAYSCNYKKNKECTKTHCQYIDGIEGCTNTTQWKYARSIYIKFH